MTRDVDEEGLEFKTLDEAMAAVVAAVEADVDLNAGLREVWSRSVDGQQDDGWGRHGYLAAGGVSADAERGPRLGARSVGRSSSETGSRRLRGIGVALLAVAASLAMVLLPTVSFDHRPPAESASAATLLRQAATAAERDRQHPDAYWYSDVRSPAEGSTRLQVWTDAAGHVTAWRNGTPLGSAGVPGQTWTWKYVAALPVAPQPLYRVLSAGTPQGVPADLQVVKSGAGLLSEVPSSGPLRSAVFQVLSRLPGMTNRGSVRDALGRQGVLLEISRPTPDHRTMSIRLILDPAGGKVLQLQSQVGSESQGPLVYVGSGYVHAVGEISHG